MSSDDIVEPEYNEEEEEEEENIIDFSSNDEQETPEIDYISLFNSYLPNFPAKYSHPGHIVLNIPSNFLPLAQKAVYGFAVSDILLSFVIDLVGGKWNQRPGVIFEHPIHKQRFIGRPLVVQLIDRFFRPDFKPRASYKSTVFLLSARGASDKNTVIELVKEGFDQQRSHSAAVLCHGNLEAARQFLKTGEMSDLKMDVPFTFAQCPLMYFVMEVAELFLGLTNHCCYCGELLKEPTVKPSVCDKQLCNVSFMSLGVGTSLIQEIKRDPEVADLMISCFATAIGTNWLNPAPQWLSPKQMLELINSLPRVSDMSAAKNDKELVELIGEEAVKLVSWILLSNKSQIIYLPTELRLKQFPTRLQFLTLISDVEKERRFKAIKSKYGSKFLWHGSSGDRWHSIIRNGLKCATGTAMQQNGNIFGVGIYFAGELAKSRVYAKPTPNKYPKSTLGTTLQAVSLCEVANVPELIDHKLSYTCVLEDAVIVRFLFISANFDYDVVKHPPIHVPKLKDVLNYHASITK